MILHNQMNKYSLRNNFKRESRLQTKMIKEALYCSRKAQLVILVLIWPISWMVLLINPNFLEGDAIQWQIIKTECHTSKARKIRVRIQEILTSGNLLQWIKMTIMIQMQIPQWWHLSQRHKLIFNRIGTSRILGPSPD